MSAERLAAAVVGAPAPSAMVELRVPLAERRAGRAFLGVVGVAAFLLLWELAVLGGVFDSRDVSPPSDIAGELWRLAGTEQLWSDIGNTLSGAAIALGFAVAGAVPIGILMGLSPALNAALRPTVEFLRPVPGIVLLPLAVLLWGRSDTTVWALVGFGCFWPMLIQAFYAAQALDEVELRTAKSFQLRRRDFIRSVVIPGSMPYLVTGLKIAVAVSLIGAVSVELLIGVPGLGSAILTAQATSQIATMYSLIVVAGILGIVLLTALAVVERRVLRWHASQRTHEDGVA